MEGDTNTRYYQPMAEEGNIILLDYNKKKNIRGKDHVESITITTTQHMTRK
jgi:hypothetical protein